MKENGRPNLKQIRIKRSVCDRLDERKGKDDSYTDVVKALLDENNRLLERNVELERDKEQLTVISKALAIQVALNNPELYNAIDMNDFHVEEQDE